MPSILITGASRGLGLTFARQYAEDGWRVFACCRDPEAAEELNALAERAGGQISVHRLDVDDGASVAALADELAEVRLDVVLNNAGVIGQRDASLGNMDYESWERTLRTNVLGPMRVAEAFVERLASDGERKLVTITSRMGSFEHAKQNAIVYRTSKAAVNMAMRCVSQQLAERGIITVLFHPGWVQTDMGGPNADLTPDESVSDMRRTIAGLDAKDNGKFLNHDGSPIPW